MYAPITLKSWPMKPSGVQFASPMRPPLRATQGVRPHARIALRPHPARATSAYMRRTAPEKIAILRSDSAMRPMRRRRVCQSAQRLQREKLPPHRGPRQHAEHGVAQAQCEARGKRGSRRQKCLRPVQLAAHDPAVAVVVGGRPARSGRRLLPRAGRCALIERAFETPCYRPTRVIVTSAYGSISRCARRAARSWSPAIRSKISVNKTQSTQPTIPKSIQSNLPPPCPLGTRRR